MNKYIFVTTTIPYVNSRPHIGHAQEFIIADCIARLYRQQGHHVRFQTGTDENASKNVLAAKKAGVSPQEFVDRNAAVFRELADKLDISYDTFIRTTDPRHRRGVELFWSQLHPDDLHSKSYEGRYCVGCEDFLLEKDLVNGICPDHQTAPEAIQEENIFFKLSKYQTQLEDLIASDKIRIIPTNRKNEVLSFIRQGLQDISLTRSKERSDGWGITVLGTPDQVIYVWIDALINYLTGQGFGESEAWKDVWNEQTQKIHIIGKNVWKFHAIYWPALLLSAGLPLPNEIIVHGFLTNNGVKISKSLGNAIDPLETIVTFGAEAIRHYLLTRVPLFTDSDFSTERLSQTYAADLSNRLGNLYSRLLVLCEKAQFSDWLDRGQLEESRKDLFDNYELPEIASVSWAEIDRINAEINEQKPWELLKSGGDEKLNSLLRSWTQRLDQAAKALSAFLPNSSETIRQGLGGKKGDRILFPKK